MQLRYNFRVEPTPGQRQALARAFGCARVVYNDGLRLREDAFRAGLPYLSDGAVLKAVTTEAKKTAERAWLSDSLWEIDCQGSCCVELVFGG